MLDEKQLAAIIKLRVLANEKQDQLLNPSVMKQSDDWITLSHVPNWVDFVLKYHTDPRSAREVEGCLVNLRDVVRRFKFNLLK